MVFPTIFGQIKISIEYPLRPPVLSLNLCSGLHEDNYSIVDCSKWYNELRALEAEVCIKLFCESFNTAMHAYATNQLPDYPN